MTPERWQEIRRLCHSALKRTSRERAAFLDQSCAGDQELRREVETLLAYEGPAEHFIEDTALAMAARQLASDEANIAPGSSLGPYEILSLLGKGGMGEVYRARDTRLGREVAIKVLPAVYAADADRWRRFEQEARVAGLLNHPNVVTIHDIGTHEGTPSIVFELLEGETLRARLKAAAPSPLPLGDAVRYALEIAHGLVAAHRKAIVHRDLKPENLFITEDGRIKILDFGLSKLTQPNEGLNIASANTGLSGAGVILGTAGYMAPEQVRGQPADHRADIFAFGAVLYEMLAGQQPFSGASAVEIMNAILKAEPPPLASQEIPPALERIVSRCVKKDAGERFQSMREVVLELGAIGSASEVAAPTRTAPQGAVSPKRIVRAVPALVGIVAVMASLAGLWWWQSRNTPAMPSPQQTLVSMFPGSHRAASFSPDGSMIAFLNSLDGVSQVWVKNLAEGEPRQITFGELPAHRPRWSPANDQIVFALGRTDLPPNLASYSIWSVPVLGGVPRKIIEDGSNPNWSPDGTRLVFERRDQIWTARADGGDQRRLEGVPDIGLLLAERAPCFSSDGLDIAFFQPEAGPRGDLWVIPSAGGQARRLTFDSTMGGTSVWTPDGRFVVYCSQRGGSLTLWRVRPSGGTPESVLLGAGEDTEPEISRDGRKLIYTTTRNSFALTVLDPSTGASRELTQTRELIVAPQFSPSGDKVAFFQHLSQGAIHLFTIESSGRNLTPVTRGDEENIMPHWSHDGRSLYFYQSSPVASFRRISVEGGQSSEVVAGWTWETQNGAQVDPTGDRVVYARRARGVTVATLTRDLRSGEETPLSMPLVQLRWSHDGQFLVGADRRPSGNHPKDRILICPVGGAPCRELAKGHAPVWSRDDRRVFFLRSAASGDQLELWSVAREGGDERQVATLLRMLPIGFIYDVSPSGDVVYVHFKEGRPELWLTDLGTR